MGFDLWQAMGVSPVAGIGIAAGGLTAAVLLAIRIGARRGKPVAGIGLDRDRR
jgi:hypothetical protein